MNVKKLSLCALALLLAALLCVINGVNFTMAAADADEITLTLANCSMDEATDVTVNVPNTGKISGRILAAEAHACNDFTNSPVASADYGDFKAKGDKITLSLPPCSVVALTIA